MRLDNMPTKASGTRLDGASNSFRTRIKASQMAWELLILAILLLVVFSPGLVRLLSAISPLIQAPTPAFIYPARMGSSSFSIASFFGQGSYNTTSSANYSASIISSWLGGKMSSLSYSAELGISSIMFVQSTTGLNWSDNSTTPVSPWIYDPAQSYTFSIRWSGEPENVTMQITPLLGGSYRYPGGGMRKDGDYYIVEIPKLPAGTYSYRWFAFKGVDIVSTPAQPYVVNKASTPVSLKLDGIVDDRIVSLGAVVQIDANITDSRAANLPIEIWADFNGSSTKMATGIGRIIYNLDTGNSAQLPLGSAVYHLSAVVAGNQNWTANTTNAQLTVANINLTNAKDDPVSGIAYAERTYQFNISCGGFISSVLFEFDGTNATASRIGNECRANKTNLNATVHTYHWWANDTAGKWYSTSSSSYEIIKANASINLLLDGQARSKIANVSDTVNLTMNMAVREPVIRTITITDPLNGVMQNDYYTNDTIQLPIDKSGSWNVTLSFAGNLNYNPDTVTRWIAVNVTDNSAPQWSNISQTTDVPVFGSTVYVWTYWQDDTLFDSVWLETNSTGVWSNSTPIYVGSPNGIANFSIAVNNVSTSPGSIIGWRIWANDTSGRRNSTGMLSFIVQRDTFFPTASNRSQVEITCASCNATDNIIGQSDTMNMSVTCGDETLLKRANLLMNVSGGWTNISFVLLGTMRSDIYNEPVGGHSSIVGSFGIPAGDGRTAVAQFAWSNESIAVNKSVGFETAIGWMIQCVDYSDNINVTDIASFTYKVFDPSDSNEDGSISQPEVVSRIESWKQGVYNILDLMRLVRIWKSGGQY